MEGVGSKGFRLRHRISPPSQIFRFFATGFWGLSTHSRLGTADAMRSRRSDPTHTRPAPRVSLARPNPPGRQGGRRPCSTKRQGRGPRGLFKPLATRIGGARVQISAPELVGSRLGIISWRAGCVQIQMPSFGSGAFPSCR